MEAQNLQVTRESLLSVVVRMPEKEVDKLFKDAKRLKKRETELINKVKNIDLSSEDQKLYGKLIKKFRAEKVTSKEHNKLTEIIDKLEEITLKRLK